MTLYKGDPIARCPICGGVVFVSDVPTRLPDGHAWGYIFGHRRPDWLEAGGHEHTSYISTTGCLSPETIADEATRGVAFQHGIEWEAA